MESLDVKQRHFNLYPNYPNIVQTSYTTKQKQTEIHHPRFKFLILADKQKNSQQKSSPYDILLFSPRGLAGILISKLL